MTRDLTARTLVHAELEATKWFLEIFINLSKQIARRKPIISGA